VVAILTGLLGILSTGLITAVAVFALRKAMEHPTDISLRRWGFIIGRNMRILSVRTIVLSMICIFTSVC
jgi:hypothetical protein